MTAHFPGEINLDVWARACNNATMQVFSTSEQNTMHVTWSNYSSLLASTPFRTL